MKYKRLGRSGIVVSDICMGTMTFGSQTDEAEAHRILDRCLDAGINFSTQPKAIPSRRILNGLAGQKILLAAG